MSPLNSSYSNTTDSNRCYENDFSKTCWTVITVICCLLGLPASMLVLRELLQRQRSSDFFMFNLTTNDVLFLCVIPFSILNTQLWHTEQIEWIDNFLDGLCLCSRPLFMSCICAECYFAVVYPIMYMASRRGLTIRKITTVLIWFSTIGFSLVKRLKTETLTFSFNATPLLIALPVITFCDISVLRALKKTDPSGNTNIHPQKKQIFLIITNSFIMTVFVYLPSVISFLISGLGPNSLKCISEGLGYAFSMTGSFIMPILYLDSVGKLQSLKELWRKYI
ncbi:P2Y purinoceptor 3-like [Astyanax mexicanus]|uniref:P2Y purinoceptor 3-like n=1 Tax=Astyanax mexicanus TaxID=7994 RepID=UPI0020CADA03|nr:P2Y purinoceptor 3-like [Astyanax mexicanus]